MKSDDKKVADDKVEAAEAAEPKAPPMPPPGVRLLAMLREMIGAVEGLADQVPGGHSITARIARLKEELESLSADAK